MYCPECGAENPDDARFCGSCGKSMQVTTPPPVTDRPTRVIEPTGGDEAVSDGLKYGVMAASLLIPLIGIVMGLYYMAKGDSEAKKGVGRLWLYVGIGIVVFYMAISGEF